MRFFKKEIPEQALLVHGYPLRFDFLATEDAGLIAELDKCIAKQRGGVIAISEEEYTAEISKKNSETQLRNNSRPPHQRHELKSLQLPPDRRVAEVVVNPGGGRRNGMLARPQVGRDGTVLNGRHDQGAMPDPIQIPTPAQFAPPPTAKLSSIK